MPYFSSHHRGGFQDRYGQLCDFCPSVRLLLPVRDRDSQYGLINLFVRSEKFC